MPPVGTVHNSTGTCRAQLFLEPQIAGDDAEMITLIHLVLYLYAFELIVMLPVVSVGGWRKLAFFAFVPDSHHGLWRLRLLTTWRGFVVKSHVTSCFDFLAGAVESFVAFAGDRSETTWDSMTSIWTYYILSYPLFLVRRNPPPLPRRSSFMSSWVIPESWRTASWLHSSVSFKSFSINIPVWILHQGLSWSPFLITQSFREYLSHSPSIHA